MTTFWEPSPSREVATVEAVLTAGAWVALAAAGIFAVGDWVAVARERKTLEYACKPLTMVALIVAAIALEPVNSSQRAWFVAALVLSMLGDVFLMLPDRKLGPADTFTFGLGSFLLGHVAYVVGVLRPWRGKPVGCCCALGDTADSRCHRRPRHPWRPRPRSQARCRSHRLHARPRDDARRRLVVGRRHGDGWCAVLRRLGRHDRLEPLRQCVPPPSRRDHGHLPRGSGAPRGLACDVVSECDEKPPVAPDTVSFLGSSSWRHMSWSMSSEPISSGRPATANCRARVSSGTADAFSPAAVPWMFSKTAGSRNASS